MKRSRRGISSRRAPRERGVLTSLPDRSRLLVRTVVVSAGAAFGYVLSEWLFLVTKPSMFSALIWPDRIGILLAAALAVGIALATVALGLAAAAGFVSARATVVRIADAVAIAVVGVIVGARVSAETINAIAVGVTLARGEWSSAHSPSSTSCPQRHQGRCPAGWSMRRSMG